MRIDYETFKNTFANRIIGFLPVEYSGWKVVTGWVPKVNGYQEALHLFNGEPECAAPTLYFRDLYRHYLHCGNVDQVCARAAEAFLRGMDYVEKAKPFTFFDKPLEHVIFQLVNAEKNGELLENAPHRRFLDLAVIYRVVADCPGGGFNSAIITREMTGEIGTDDEEELYRAALANTPELFPLMVNEIGCGIRVLTNYCRAFGAAAALYPQVLDELAEDMGRDLLLLPSSVHEFFVVPDIFERPYNLKEIIKEANQVFCGKEDMLSENVYIYNREKRELEIVR